MTTCNFSDPVLYDGTQPTDISQYWSFSQVECETPSESIPVYYDQNVSDFFLSSLYVNVIFYLIVIIMLGVAFGFKVFRR